MKKKVQLLYLPGENNQVGPKMAHLDQKSRFSRIPQIFTERGIYHWKEGQNALLVCPRPFSMIPQHFRDFSKIAIFGTLKTATYNRYNNRIITRKPYIAFGMHCCYGPIIRSAYLFCGTRVVSIALQVFLLKQKLKKYDYYICRANQAQNGLFLDRKSRFSRMPQGFTERGLYHPNRGQNALLLCPRPFSMILQHF